MISRDELLLKYHIDENEFDESGIGWDQIEEIHNDFSSKRHSLNNVAQMVANELQEVNGVHSVRWRIKDPEHLAAKVIRKIIDAKKNGIERKINIANYENEITDLIGVRALHLYKDGWELIHKFIKENWELNEEPCANIRKGDPQKFIERFSLNGCRKNEHSRGYRSVHYIIKVKPKRKINFVEIQVRTIFEEAWSEIDHDIYYPAGKENTIILDFLDTFNRIAGTADEMGSFISQLNKQMIETSSRTKELEDEIEKTKSELKKTKMSKDQKKQIVEVINSYKDTASTINNASPFSAILQLSAAFAGLAALSQLMKKSS